jgi:hypothetical protein
MRNNEVRKLVRRFVADFEAMPEDRRQTTVEGWVNLRLSCGLPAAADHIRAALGECPSCGRVLTLAGFCPAAGVPGSGCRVVAHG